MDEELKRHIEREIDYKFNILYSSNEKAIRSLVNENMDNMLRNQLKDVKRQMLQFIKIEIDYRFSEDGLNDIVKSIMTENFKFKNNDIIKETITRTFKEINRRFKREYNTMKELVLSTDTEIKSVLRNPELSLDTQEHIKNVISKKLNIEHKKQSDDELFLLDNLPKQLEEKNDI